MAHHERCATRRVCVRPPCEARGHEYSHRKAVVAHPSIMAGCWSQAPKPPRRLFCWCCLEVIQTHNGPNYCLWTLSVVLTESPGEVSRSAKRNTKLKLQGARWWSPPRPPRLGPSGCGLRGRARRGACGAPTQQARQRGSDAAAPRLPAERAAGITSRRHHPDPGSLPL